MVVPTLARALAVQKNAYPSEIRSESDSGQRKEWIIMKITMKTANEYGFLPKLAVGVLFPEGV
jgi:hypothetical protein